MKKRIVSTLIALSLTASALAGTAVMAFAEEAEVTEETVEIPGPDGDDNVITVGAVPTPHAEVLEEIREDLEAAGWELEIVVFQDYVLPNQALDAGELDANYFQHAPYLEDFNEKNGTDLSGTVPVHFEPLGLYAGKSDDLDNIADGAVVAIPNDTTNEARALLLLQDNGLITINEDAGLQATPLDITDNPHNLEFKEMEAAQVARIIEDVDFAVVNGNYAIDAKIKDQLLVAESPDSEAAQTYANLVVVKTENLETAKTKALSAAITTDKVRDFITDTYEGAVVAVF